MKISYIILFSFFFSHALYAQPFAKWTDSELVLNNGIVSRRIQLPAIEGTFVTTHYAPVYGEFAFFKKENADFQFEVNGVVYSGKSKWQLVEVKAFTDTKQGDGAAVTLKSFNQKIELTIVFLLYPNSPAIRKHLTIKNLTGESVALESVDVEKFEFTPYYPATFSWIFSDYGRRKSIGPYEGNMQDALVIMHNMDWDAGIVIGNEATGVLKRTAFLWEAADLTAGLTHKNARFPFRKWIAPNSTFTTPQVFTMVYNQQKDPSQMLNIAVPDFVRKHMGIRLSELETKPTFVYNTWNPFKKDINENLIRELAKAAADAGMKEFVIDDGWQDSYGDWNIDLKKFPNGLKPVFEYIKSLGMKPGLWISVGSASTDSKVFKEHPEWFVKGKNDDFANLHIEGEISDVQSACFTTGWKDYIKNILLKLTIDYGLEYMKLDFAVVSSAYVFDQEKSGCYASDHSGHKDHHESMYENYERMWVLFDELHFAKPDLFIDCTFEAMGGLQLIDYAMLKHAEGNWLSNFDGLSGEKTDLRVRNMAWWRSPAMPATALVIGNPQMQDKGWDMHIKSLAGALPIMLGDPRALSETDFKKYRFYADWLQNMEKNHGIMTFRQDLTGLGEPMEGNWDGFQRINTETKSGGIIGVFRHGSLAKRQLVIIHYLDPEKMYTVKDMRGKVVTKQTGRSLEENGFEVTLNGLYDGVLYEISNL